MHARPVVGDVISVDWKCNMCDILKLILKSLHFQAPKTLLSYKWTAKTHKKFSKLFFLWCCVKKKVSREIVFRVFWHSNKLHVNLQ